MASKNDASASIEQMHVDPDSDRLKRS